MAGKSLIQARSESLAAIQARNAAVCYKAHCAALDSVQHATEQDLVDAWKHACRYAISCTTAEGARAYAVYYMAVVGDESDMAHWPGHTLVFGIWRRLAGEQYAIG